jgi:hypothetical protein
MRPLRIILVIGILIFAWLFRIDATVKSDTTILVTDRWTGQAAASGAGGIVSGWGFLSGAIGAGLAWIFAEFFGRPFRQFFDLRREVNSSLVRFGNVRARAQVNGDGRVVSLNQLAPPEEERLRLFGFFTGVVRTTLGR